MIGDHLYNLDADPSYGKIPQRIMDALIRYGKEHLPPGGFLTEVLSNELSAVFKADPEVLPHLKPICWFVYNQMPNGCHGSRDHVERWIQEPTEGDQR